MYENYISVIFASLTIITLEWWLIYSCQDYFDHLSKATLKGKDFFLLPGISHTLDLRTSHAVGCSCSLAPQPTKANFASCLVRCFPCALREGR